LLIISHTPHYRREGEIVGWGATVREIDHLATLFERVVHIAPLHADAAPASSLPYQSSRVRLRFVSPSGGERLRDKLNIPLRYPGYARVILQERRAADVIHVRSPASISLLALMMLAVLRGPQVRWAKYAGDWNRNGAEPWSYRFQRWWLSHGLHRGLVTVNGRWPNQGAHIRSFLNPCLTEAELKEGAEAARSKRLGTPVQLLFVGRLESAKGVGICLEILAQLDKAGIAARLDLIGDGEERHQLEQKARDLNVFSNAKFHGGLPRAALGRFYGQAHFILLPTTCSEGWPKVLSEAMAYGAVPIASPVSSIPQYLSNFSCGQVVNSRNARSFSQALESYLRAPAGWEEHSKNALNAAQNFSYTHYLNAVRELLSMPFSAEPACA
ncbi:MAG: hypothetical protein DME22_24615, partial [Verrucomicrobia bacterium]